MGKNITIYIKDDVLELIEGIEGKGTLINSLILEHFSNDEEILLRRLNILERESNFARKKLEDKKNTRLQAEESRKKKDEVSRGEVIRRESLNEWKRKYKDDEITEDQYLKAFNKKGKFARFDKNDKRGEK